MAVQKVSTLAIGSVQFRAPYCWEDLDITEDYMKVLLSRDEYAPVLSAKPANTTVTYTDPATGIAAYFHEGQCAIYADSNLPDGYGLCIAKKITYNASNVPTSVIWLDTSISKANVEGLLTGTISTHTHTFASLVSKPTTLSGYGITDAVTINTAQTISGAKTFSTALTAASLKKSGGTATQFLMADGSVATKKVASSVSTVDWTNNATHDLIIPTMSFMAYWNGAYKESSSNLAYCTKGAFGTMATKNAADYLTKTEITNAYQPKGSYLTAITKAQVESVLTGNITTHTHSQYLTAHQSLANYVTLNGAQTISGRKSFSSNVVLKGIEYQGAKAAYTMISFIDNTVDGYGNGIAIGGGGTTIIGGGESADTLKATISNGGGENLILCNDEYIDIYTNCQNGLSSAVHTTIKGDLFSGVAANANALGGKAAAQYVTTDTNQIINSTKVFVGTQNIRFSTDTSNAIGISWRNTANNATLQSIVAHNTAQRIILNPNGSAQIYNDAVGKYSLLIGVNELTYNTNAILHAGNYASILNSVYQAKGNYLTSITKAQVEAVLTGNITTHTHSQYLTAHQSLANYVTLNGAQTISGAKTFSSAIKTTATQGFLSETATGIWSYMRLRSNTAMWDIAVKDTDTSGALQFRVNGAESNRVYITPAGEIKAPKFTKIGGTSSQFLKADGSVDTNAYALASHAHTFASLTSKPTTLSGYGITDAITAATASSTYVKKAGDSMTGRLQISTQGLVLDIGAQNTSGIHIYTSNEAKPIFMNTSLQFVGNGDVGNNGSYRVGTVYANAINVASNSLVSHLNADLLDGVHNGALSANDAKYCKLIDTITPSTHATVKAAKDHLVTLLNQQTWGIGWPISIGASFISQWDNESAASSSSSSYCMFKIGGSYNAPQYGQWMLSSYNLNNIGVVGRSNNAWSSIKWLAFTTDNVASATKLQTARTLWGQSFNGTANVSGALSGVTDITMSGNLNIGVNKITSGSDNMSLLQAANAQRLLTGGLLTSDSYADKSKIPAGGIYSKGNITTAGTLSANTLNVAQNTLVSNLNADMVDGVHNGSLTANKINANSLPAGGSGLSWFSGQVTVGTAAGNAVAGSSATQNLWSFPDGGTAITNNKANIMDLHLSWDSTNYWVDIFTSPNYEGLWYRLVGNKVAQPWRKIAFISDNVASATKLHTARTINGTSFNGTANITTANWGTARNISISDSAGTNTGTAVSVNGSAAATLKLPATIAAALSGNASSATKLQTARTIWGQSFNGTANVSGALTGVTNITASGTIHATTGIYSDNYVSAKGQNTSSDARLKDVTSDFTLDLNQIANAPSVNFSWKDSHKADVGSIAQYWRGISPYLTPDMPDGSIGLQYGKTALLSVITVAKKTINLQEKVDALEKKVIILEQEKTSLESRIKKLETI